MTVVYTCDDNFVWIMGISMISLFENNRDMENLEVYLLGDHVSDTNKDVLLGIANKYGRTCSFVDVPDLKIPTVDGKPCCQEQREQENLGVP